MEKRKLEKVDELFHSELHLINVGPRLMGEAMEKQGVDTIYVDWQPAAGGDKEMQDLLDELGF